MLNFIVEVVSRTFAACWYIGESNVTVRSPKANKTIPLLYSLHFVLFITKIGYWFTKEFKCSIVNVLVIRTCRVASLEKLYQQLNSVLPSLKEIKVLSRLSIHCFRVSKEMFSWDWYLQNCFIDQVPIDFCPWIFSSQNTSTTIINTIESVV
jgi:hypothetical protein